MKPLYFIAGVILLAWACSPVKDASKTSATVALSGQDSTEYEIYISDPGFDIWYQLNYSEPKDHSYDYYHAKNLVAVSKWNDYYRQGRSIEVIDSYIDYQPQIDYGIEVDRKLYWYFKYAEEKYKVQLFR